MACEMQLSDSKMIFILLCCSNSILKAEAGTIDIHGNLDFEKDLTLSANSEVGSLGDLVEDSSISTNNLVKLDTTSLDLSKLLNAIL